MLWLPRLPPSLPTKPCLSGEQLWLAFAESDQWRGDGLVRSTSGFLLGSRIRLRNRAGEAPNRKNKDQRASKISETRVIAFADSTRPLICRIDSQAQNFNSAS
jgi:hypothetical protein